MPDCEGFYLAVGLFSFTGEICPIAIFKEKSKIGGFKASGQYRDDKPNAYYERMATEEMQFVSGLREKPMAPAASATAKAGRFANVKS